MTLRLQSIVTFPERREPGVELPRVEVGEAGLAGDRPKRAAVSLVGHDSPHTRANLVLNASTAEVEALAGQVLRIGEVLLAVEATGNACAGLYASVGGSGTLRVGDEVDVIPPER